MTIHKALKQAQRQILAQQFDSMTEYKILKHWREYEPKRVEVLIWKGKRGVHSRGMLEGGEQERALAHYYRKNMEAIDLTAPRTAAILDRIATIYENEGRANDNEAERRSW